MTGPTLRRRGKILALLYKIAARRAQWKHGHSREAAFMVKGTNRRVIVVKSPDPQVFEEAIFVLREDYARERSAEQVVEEARRAAGEYLQKNGAGRKRPGERLWGAVIAAAGALAAGIAWLTLHFASV